MAEKKGKPKFIRKNGRIIPIRSSDKNKTLVKNPIGKKPPPKKKERKSLFKAAGFLGLGGLSSLFAGSAFAEFGTEAMHRKNASIGLFKRGQAIKRNANVPPGDKKNAEFIKKQSKSFTRAGAFQRASGSRIAKTGGKIGGVALSAGSILLGMGLYEAFSQLTGGEPGDAEVFIAAGGGLATSAAASEFGKKTGVSKEAAKRVILALAKRR